MHPTSDSWYPSYDKGHRDEPGVFEECDCYDCCKIPSVEKQRHARWNWQQGGRVACFFWAFDHAQYPKCNVPENVGFHARVSFWGLDDTGMEKWFEYEEDARRFVCHLPAYISREFLFDHGFQMC